MKSETPIDWQNFTQHTRIEEQQGKRMIPTFKPHPDWGYQWKPISGIKQKGRQLYRKAASAVQSKHSW